jgi:hypothetical protein
MPNQNEYHPNPMISNWLWRLDNGYIISPDMTSSIIEQMEQRKETPAWSTYTPEMKEYVNRMIDDAKLIQSGINPLTGQPIE